MCRCEKKNPLLSVITFGERTRKHDGSRTPTTARVLVLVDFDGRPLRDAGSDQALPCARLERQGPSLRSDPAGCGDR